MTVGIPLFDANGELKYAVCFNTVSMEQINSIQRNYRRMQDSLQHYSQGIAELRTRATSTNLLFKSAPMQRLWTLMQNTATPGPTFSSPERPALARSFSLTASMPPAAGRASLLWR